MILRNFINNEEVNDPLNLPDFEIELNFDKNSVQQTLSLTSIEWGVNNPLDSKDAYQLIKKHENSQVGVIEGLPYKLLLDNQRDTPLEIFNGYLDVWAKEQSRNENGDVIKLNAVEQGKLDWLNDVADSFTFEYLYSIGVITNSDFIQVPYCINKKNNAFELVITSFTFFVIIDKLHKQYTEFSEKVVQAGNPFEATVIARAVFHIIYITTLLIALAKIIIDLYNFIIQPVKYHTAMSVTRMLEIGCNHLGLTFKSSILQQEPFNKLYWLPEKFALNERNSISGLVGNLSSNIVDNTGFYNGTFGEFLRMWQQVFNAKIICKDDSVYFEKYNYNPSANNWVVPNLMDSKYNYSYNKDDFYSNINISFAYDLNDKNTIQEWKGTNCQVIQSAISVNNVKMNLAKNFLDVRHPFALGKIKTELNTIEKIFDKFFKVVGGVLDTIIKIVNKLIDLLNEAIKLINKLIKSLSVLGIDLKITIPKIPSVPATKLSNLIENRIGMLQMENDFVNTPKAILLDVASNPKNTKVNTNNSAYLNAKYLYDNYWYFVSFVPKGSFEGNQWLIRELNECKFTYSDYVKVRYNNMVTDAYGNECELISLKYNPLRETAKGTYKQRKKYLNNIKETIIEPNGN